MAELWKKCPIGKDFDVILRLAKTNLKGLTGFDSKMKRFVSMPCFVNAARKTRFSNF